MGLRHSTDAPSGIVEGNLPMSPEFCLAKSKPNESLCASARYDGGELSGLIRTSGTDSSQNANPVTLRF